MRGLMVAGPAACVLGWLGGSHLLWALAAALAYAPCVAGIGARGHRLVGAVVAPVLLLAAVPLDGLLDVRVLPVLAASVLAWVPLLAELGGRVPLAVWTLPIVLAVTAVALVGPWGLVLVASDIAVRAQVLVMGGAALVAHSVARDMRA